MKLKWMLLVIGLSLSDLVVGATFKQKIELTVGKAHDQAHRSPESYGFQASLDGSALRVEQKRFSFYYNYHKPECKSNCLYSSLYRSRMLY